MMRRTSDKQGRCPMSLCSLELRSRDRHYCSHNDDDDDDDNDDDDDGDDDDGG